MLIRFREKDDDDGRDIEELYGTPQHETSGQTPEKELYGKPQHHVPDNRFPSEFDPDLGYVLDWFDQPWYVNKRSTRL
ncbi:hypothetical protein [Haladaptatus sp. NG-SE-30]